MLKRAVELYDPAFGIKFTTYAKLWIRQAMVEAVETQGSLVRIPRHARKKSRKVARGQIDLSTIKPKRRDMYVASGLMVQQWAEPSRRRSESILIPGSPDRIDALELADARDAVGRLAERERIIVQARYDEDLTFVEIGKRLGLTSERIRQIHDQAVSKLRERFAC